MRELEQLLVQRVNETSWVMKYGEEESFGVMKEECQQFADGGGERQLADDDDDDMNRALAENIKINPLFRMNRAECLLALFISTVERPKLEMMGKDVAGGSAVDFIDSDRLEVLLKS